MNTSTPIQEQMAQVETYVASKVPFMITTTSKIYLIDKTTLSLAEMQELVGGLIEPLYPLVTGSLLMTNNYMLICDEESKIKHKEFNHLASSLWGNTYDLIAGDVIVMPSSFLK